MLIVYIGTSQAQWRESLWLAEALPRDKKAVFNWEGSVQLPHSDYMYDTRLEPYGSLFLPG